MYDLRVVVEEVRGFCDLPMCPGDYFEVRGGRITIPEGKHICLWALSSLLPMLPAKQRNIVEDNDWLPSTQHMCCPDPNGMVIYRIERLESGSQVPSVDKPFPRMLVNETLCSGCRACELTCSFTHSQTFAEGEARIRVSKCESEGIDSPKLCRQCGSAPCVKACPREALSRDPQTKAVKLDEDLCTGCLACAKACSFGSIHIHPKTKLPMFCNLCGGNPECVDRCPTGAISFGRAGEPPLKGGPKAAIK